MILSNYLKKVEEEVDSLIEGHKKVTNTNCLIAFRGENKDYEETKLMPSLFRNENYIEKEKYLFELLDDYGFIQPNQKRNIEKAIEAQHYIAISRMLDITFNLFVAIFFACKGNENENGIIYIFCFPEHYSPHSQYIEEFYTHILNDKNISYSSNFKVISHSHSNNRIKAQNGGFIFFTGKEFRPIPNVYYKKVIIEKNDKRKIFKELDLIFNMNESTIFPEKEKIIQVVKQKFEQGVYKKRLITIEGEVDSYFERIDYELSMNCYGDNIDLLRYLRKEKSDLLYYISQNYCNSIDNNISDNHMLEKELIKKIENSFNFLLLKYRRI